MNRTVVIALMFVAAAVGASAEQLVAVVRVRDIYAALPATEDLQKQVKLERDAILRDPRAEALRRIIAELQSIQARLSDKKNPLDDASAVKMARQYELTRQEAQTLQRDYETFRAEREKEINRRMIAGMRASLSLIHETARKVGAEKGYDLVIDNTGNTNTGVTFLLYQKNTPDLSDAVVAVVEQKPDNASASPVEPPNP